MGVVRALASRVIARDATCDRGVRARLTERASTQIIERARAKGELRDA